LILDSGSQWFRGGRDYAPDGVIPIVDALPFIKTFWAAQKNRTRRRISAAHEFRLA